MFTQTLIIHVIRTNKIPFIQSRASTAAHPDLAGHRGVGAYLPFSRWRRALGLVPLPPLYWLYLLECWWVTWC